MKKQSYESDISNINKELSSMFDKEYVRFTQNGTTGIWALLKALDFKEKKIILPVNICFVVPCAVVLSGNTPVFVDIDSSFSASPDLLEKINDPDIAAMIYPYNNGNIGQLDRIIDISNEKNWVLIEDTCQSLGAKYDGKYVGSFSDYSFTSFGQGKILDANGGGAVAVNDSALFSEINKIIDGISPSSTISDLLNNSFGSFYRSAVDSIENDLDINYLGKAISFSFKDGLIVGLNMEPRIIKFLSNEIRNIDDYVEVRSRNASYYQSLINHPCVKVLSHSSGSVYWRQNILVPKESRGNLMKYLDNNNIKVSKYFPSIDRCFHSRNNRNEYKYSDQMYSELINLWPGHHTKYPDIEHLSLLLNNFFE